MSENNVVIIDYRLGNLFSVKQACEKVGLSVVVSSDPEDVARADGLLLPGVGAFGSAMENLREFDLIEPIRDFVATGGPLFGICLGMQLLFDESEEFGIHQGLGILPGRIVRFPSQTVGQRHLKVPSIGWQRVNHRSHSNAGDSNLRKALSSDDWMYFVHSYYCCPELEEDILTETTYGEVRFCSSVLRRNIFGTQFHPEKSGVPGLRIYESWSRTLAERKVAAQ